MKYTDDGSLPEVTEQDLFAAQARFKPFTVIILKHGPNYPAAGPRSDPDVFATIVRHGRRNASLRLAGLLRVVCPVNDGSDVAGVGVFDATPEDVERIYSRDPAIKAGILTYEVHATQTFPDSCLS
ncbi:MAG TPA: hypothetical protein VFL29_06390 [Candidatus Dormibacteraeota bacterium]|nr:hypothetical protein [Candidatus Dormibacteraeota bacterium]